MLVLSRKVGEKVVIGDNITIVVNRVSGNRISLGIAAPADVRIVRGELAQGEVTSKGQQDLESSLGAPVPNLPTFEFASSAVSHRAR